MLVEEVNYGPWITSAAFEVDLELGRLLAHISSEITAKFHTATGQGPDTNPMERFLGNWNLVTRISMHAMTYQKHKACVMDDIPPAKHCED